LGRQLRLAGGAERRLRAPTKPQGSTTAKEVEHSSRGGGMEASWGLCLAETVDRRDRVAVVVGG